MYKDKSPAQWVDTTIGNIGHLLKATKPTVMIPHGMMQIQPYTDPDIIDRYYADKIQGFPIASNVIIPSNTNLGEVVEDWYSIYDHDLEVARGHYYSVELLSSNIKAEYTVSHHSCIFRFSDECSNMLIISAKDAKVNIDSNKITIEDVMEKVPSFSVLDFNKNIINQTQFTTDEKLITKLSFDSQGELLLRSGISHIDNDQAIYNLDNEIPDYNFESVKDKAKKIWDDILGKVEIESGSDDEKTVFYTSLYRAHIRMVNYSEYGRYYSGYDNQVHDCDGQDFYCDDGIWDTYRCMHPMQVLLDTQRQNDIIQSYVRMYEQSGWMPSFPYLAGDKAVMIGFHAAAVLTDAYYKGLRNFDYEKAYEGMKKNAMQKTMLPWNNDKHTELDECYLNKGFFPGLYPDEKEWVTQVHDFERRQSVAVTMEHAYDDWCVYRLAQALGKTEDAEYFKKRAKNYANVYNSKIGFVAPKDADGNWIEPYSPKWCGGVGGRDYYAENNAYIYNFHVQHDILGIAKLMGGTKNMEEKLDNLYVEQYDGKIKSEFLHQYPDATGLMGQFPMGNEPSFHIPYMYNYTASPWKTQKKVRENIRLWFTNSPYGICGDEDGGAMSAWLVMSAMGIYPVCPGRPIYDITSPLFDKITIHLENGNDFIISAPNSNTEHKYIQSATLNSKEHNTPWISHDDIMAGGKLEMVMGEKPNYDWGVSGIIVPSMDND